MSERTFKLGDRVTPDPHAMGVPPKTVGRVFKVAKINPRNLKCTAEDGGRGISFPPELLLPATEENLSPAEALRPRPFEPIEFFDLGAIVTFKRGWRDIGTNDPLVVLSDKGADKINVTRLGGDGDRYVRAPRTAIVKRDRAWLANALMEQESKP